MQKVVFITGVSSGFGFHTAGLLAKDGFRVYGTVRKPVNPVEGVNLLMMDLTDSASVKKAVAAVIEKEGRIDILINNAGMHTGGSVETTPAEAANLQLATNITGMMHLLREVLPVMRAQKSGTVVNFSSIGGLMGLPFQGFYSASKFAVEGISEALRMEVRQFGIKVVVINPGDFHTHNTQNRQLFIKSDPHDPYDAQFRRTLAVIENDETNGWPPERLARKLVAIVKKENPAHRYIIASAEQKLAVVLSRILPSAWFSRILATHYGIK